MVLHLQPFSTEDSVAQLVEHIPFKDGVLGSRPSGFTKPNSLQTVGLCKLINSC